VHEETRSNCQGCYGRSRARFKQACTACQSAGSCLPIREILAD
jgi:hypothetical protein